MVGLLETALGRPAGWIQIALGRSSPRRGACGVSIAAAIDRTQPLGLPSSNLRPAKPKRPQKGPFGFGAPGKIRTCGPQIRNLVLYPTELRALRWLILADRGNAAIAENVTPINSNVGI